MEQDSLGLWSHPQLLAALADQDWGTVFRTYRKLTGLSQTKLGERVGLAQSDVSDIERGHRRVTSSEVRAHRRGPGSAGGEGRCAASQQRARGRPRPPRTWSGR